MSLNVQNKRTALAILAFLSTAHREKLDAFCEHLSMPKSILMQSMDALQAAHHVELSPLKQGDEGSRLVTITPAGQAYLLENIEHLETLIDLLEFALVEA